MPELSSYPAVTTLAGTDRIPVITNPGVGGGNKYITAANLYAGGGSMTAAAILAALITVDGAGSGLDADLLDGVSSTGFATVVTPEAYGAVRDGTTDDTTAFNAAQATLTAGGVVTLSKGTYKTKIAPTKGGVTYKGAGMWATTLVPPAATAYQIEWAAVATDIAFEDMAFDFSALSSGYVALLNGASTSNVRFSRCRFYNVPGRSIASQGLTGLVVEGCLFHTPGTPLRNFGVNTDAGTRKVVIRDNTFLYCNTGVSASNNCDDIVIHKNYFDQGWWLGASVATGTGAPVTYTATVLTDTGANFATLAANGVGWYVRTMATRRTNSGGTVTYTYSGNKLVDTAASFVADGVLKGEIIRVGSVFGVVESVVSATTLQVEQWLSSTTYLPVAEPAAGAAYTAHKIVVGYISSGTATTLTTGRWYDLDGTASTPSAGTLYEVIPVGIYPIHLDTCRGIKVTNNILKRGWADQISLFGQEAQIIGNTIEDGQDYGLTCHGGNNIVGFNRVRHQGVVGITCGDNDSIVVGNDVWGCQWTNSTVTASIAGIVISGPNTVATGNKVDGGSRAMSYYGLTVYAYTGIAVTGCLVANNHATRCATSDLFLDQNGTGTISGLKWYGNSGTLGRGAGVPASALSEFVPGRSAATNLALGITPHQALTSGTNNTAVGQGAQAALTTGGSNTALGLSAQGATLTGTGNTAIGYLAQQVLSTGGYNTAIGMQSQAFAVVTGSYNVGVGSSAQQALTSGYSNAALGHGAQTALTTGGQNIGVGHGAQAGLTTGSSNVGIGPLVQAGVLTGNFNVAVGLSAQGAITTASNNVAVGSNAQAAIIGGGSNVAVGGSAQAAITNTSNNTAVGYLAQSAMTTGAGNVAVGKSTQTGVLTGDRNIGIGENAQAALTSGGYNTGIGYDVQKLVTTANYNTAVGASSQHSMTSGASNTAVGYNAQGSLTTGGANTALGHVAQQNLTTGGNNTAIGYNSQGGVITGNSNTAVGFQAQNALTGGSNNVAIGNNSQVALTTGGNNTAIGYDAQAALTTANYNTAVGFQAQKVLTTGASNTAVGYLTQGAVTTGADNTAVGYSALNNGANVTTTANRQVAMGRGAGQGSAAQSDDITTIGYNATGIGTGAVSLGSGASAPFAGSVALGMSTVTTVADQVGLGLRHLEMQEITAPAAGATNSARLFLVDVAGKTALQVQFATGTAIQLAIEA